MEKWLFRYPDQKIETVNYAVIPEGTPVKFVLHAHDAMNSFWVPELGGQMYTMPDMPMKLWLQADHPGNYLGRSANFSGEGFAGMEFHILAKSRSNFKSWVKDVKATKPALTTAKYKQLLKPNNVGTMTFSSYPKALDKENYTEMKDMKSMSDRSKSKDSMKGGDDK
ncbi:cytochrome ubiquinol oxidase subunit II [Terrilactibacillus sp. S3-3]|nr:cytochrome ubiquinol oxidase subunit II [Terrilactibacillus sp. S3-3]